MTTQEEKKDVLAAEANPSDGACLRDLLIRLGYRPYLVTSAQELTEAIRHHIFAKAVVGVEFLLGKAPALSILSGLPTITRLIAVGPPGDQEAEKFSRVAGAHVYLPRPVNAAYLTKALWYRPSNAYVPTTPSWR